MYKRMHSNKTISKDYTTIKDNQRIMDINSNKDLIIRRIITNE
jgi:hypothetical protein